MLEIDPTQYHRRAGEARFRNCSGRWKACDGSRKGSGDDVSGAGPLPLVKCNGKRFIWIKVETRFERREVAEFYLQLVHLEQFKQAHIHELSGGMKQRVALARALAPNSRILLMDEPFTALEAMTLEQLYTDLQEIWEKRRKTIVFVTHNVREACCLGDRVVIFSPRPGRICEEFQIHLKRPRDVNDVELAYYATEVMQALRNHMLRNSAV